MSRIHEALKKAEQERAAVPTGDRAAQPADATGAPASPPPNTVADMPANGAETFARASARAPLSASYLRFDELRAHCAHPHWSLDPNVNVFFNSSLSEHGAEQFRTLRSRLYQLRGTQQLRTVLVTSSVQGEGKTFVTSNLAQAIVRQPDRRVLMIDADLRCSRLHVPLGAPSNPGLTDYLRGDADEMAVIQHGQEGNLCFIPGGNEVTNPSELLSNGRLKTLLDRVTPVFDWVILDSPPCLPVADASVLADLVDGVLMIVRAASTQAETAQRACQELRGRNLLGVVLNAVEETHASHSYYYTGYGYGYGRHDDKSSPN
jgi:protein-tyrosine kinase